MATAWLGVRRARLRGGKAVAYCHGPGRPAPPPFLKHASLLCPSSRFLSFRGCLLLFVTTTFLPMVRLPRHLLPYTSVSDGSTPFPWSPSSCGYDISDSLFSNATCSSSNVMTIAPYKVYDRMLQWHLKQQKKVSRAVLDTQRSRAGRLWVAHGSSGHQPCRGESHSEHSHLPLT
jgi:hypothetical protein